MIRFLRRPTPSRQVADELAAAAPLPMLCRLFGHDPQAGYPYRCRDCGRLP